MVYGSDASSMIRINFNLAIVDEIVDCFSRLKMQNFKKFSKHQGENRCTNFFDVWLILSLLIAYCCWLESPAIFQQKIKETIKNSTCEKR